MNYTIQSKNLDKLHNAVTNFNSWQNKNYPKDKLLSVENLKELRKLAKDENLTAHIYYRKFRIQSKFKQIMRN